jgi:hypothetical protein
MKKYNLVFLEGDDVDHKHVVLKSILSDGISSEVLDDFISRLSIEYQDVDESGEEIPISEMGVEYGFSTLKSDGSKHLKS